MALPPAIKVIMHVAVTRHHLFVSFFCVRCRRKNSLLFHFCYADTMSGFLSGYAEQDEKGSLSHHFGGISGGKSWAARLTGRIPTIYRDYCRDWQ
jgi:hypothetical protein